MGMYIIGKEPDRCGACPCFHAETPMYCQAVKAAVQKPRIVRPYAEGRPEWCPIIEVPKHGRLIDQPKIIEKCRNNWCGDNWFNCIVNAPTVIPASDKDINVLGKEEGE